MSHATYADDDFHRGKRGQKLLRDMVAALDAMPEKSLIRGQLEDSQGGVCALGCVGRARGIDLRAIGEFENFRMISIAFDASLTLVREIAIINDCPVNETPMERWKRMRAWAAGNIKQEDSK